MKIDPGVPPTYDLTCAQVSEVLDLSKRSMPWRMLLSNTKWLNNTAGGPLPSTIEQATPYTPLNTSRFDNLLSYRDNNIQAALETLDEHTHAGLDAREILTANRTYYVRKDGANLHTGLVNNAAGAWLTIQYAIDQVYKLDLSIYDVVIQVGDGTYYEDVVLSGPFVGTGTVTLRGNTSTPSYCYISGTSYAITVENYCVCVIEGFKLTSTYASDLIVQQVATVTLGVMEYSTSNTPQIYIVTGGRAICLSNYTISGTSGAHMQLEDGGFAKFIGMTVTLLTGSTFYYCVLVTRGAILIHAGATFTGSYWFSVRYSGDSLALIYTNGGGANYFPGTNPGSVANGAQYL